MDKVLFFKIQIHGVDHTPTRKEWAGLVAARRRKQEKITDPLEYDTLEELIITQNGEVEKRMSILFDRLSTLMRYEVRFFPSEGIFKISVVENKWLKDAIRHFTETEFCPKGGEIIPLGMRLFHSTVKDVDVDDYIHDEASPLERFLRREEAWYRVGEWLYTVAEATCRLEPNNLEDPYFYYAGLVARAWQGLGVVGDFDPGYVEELNGRTLFDLIYGSLSEELSHMGGSAPRITKRQFAQIWAMITRYRLE